MSRAEIPVPCGVRRCYRPASYADSAGVGYCSIHRDEDCVRADFQHPFDAWWEAATKAAKRGGKEAALWRGLEYGQWPDGAADRAAGGTT